MLARGAARLGLVCGHSSSISPVPAARRIASSSRLLATSINVSNAASLQTSSMRTEVLDRKSPASLIEQKAKELQQIGPSGYSKLLLYQLVSLPLWVMTAAGMAVKYATRPGALFKRPDPSAFKLTPPFPLHEEFIKVDGIQLHTVSPGRRPDKPLMLFVHGFPECWYSWRHQMVALQDDYDVVAIDMRGYNTSDKPQGVDQYMLRQLASDIKEAVHALGHSSCTLVAHDWGGVVAWVVAGMFGKDLVNQLIVMALPHFGVAMTNYTMQQYTKQTYILVFQAPGLAELYVAGDNAAALDGAFRSPKSGCRNPSAMTAADTDWFRAAACHPGAATAMLNYYRALVKFTTVSDRDDPAWRALRTKLEMPTLVLHGDSDMALGEELLDGIEAAVPQSTVKVFKNCSHWIQQDYPQQVTDVMQEWLQQQGKKGQ